MTGGIIKVGIRATGYGQDPIDMYGVSCMEGRDGTESLGFDGGHFHPPPLRTDQGWTSLNGVSVGGQRGTTNAVHS